MKINYFHTFTLQSPQDRRDLRYDLRMTFKRSPDSRLKFWCKRMNLKYHFVSFVCQINPKKRFQTRYFSRMTGDLLNLLASG